MVDDSKAQQFQGFDYNDYVFADTSAWTWDYSDGLGPVPAVNDIQIYIAGTQANLQVVPAPVAPFQNLAWVLANLIPLPAAGGPAINIGPQYPWPYHGSGPGPVALPAFVANGLLNPFNIAPVQKTLFRVITNDVFVYMLDRRMAQSLYAALLVNLLMPDGAFLAEGGPGTFAARRWPLPVPVLLQADIGMYESERKWIWLLVARAVADADADLHVYMEG